MNFDINNIRILKKLLGMPEVREAYRIYGECDLVVIMLKQKHYGVASFRRNPFCPIPPPEF